LINIDSIAYGEGGHECKETTPMVVWKLVIRPKLKGGHGVIKLRLQNDALLMKHLHKFYSRGFVLGATYLNKILQKWQSVKPNNEGVILVEKLTQVVKCFQRHCPSTLWHWADHFFLE
jgi:hypothetical protein